MALPFIGNGTKKKRDQMLAVDLGSRTTKVVHVHRRGQGFALSRYALLDTPVSEKAPSTEMLTDHLKAIRQAVDAKPRLSLALTVGVNDAVVRHVEMPPMPVEDMRQVLKINSRAYLQQELNNHVFDCDVSTRSSQSKAAKAPKNGPAPQKQKVLIAGAKKQLVDDFAQAVRNAGMVPEHIFPGILGPVNAFERALPEVFAKEVIALVDIGFKSSSISILQEGELVLNRVVSIGGDRITAGLAEAMNITYAEAEGIKVGMAQEVESALEGLVSPLGRELRASIDFFEHQQDRPVSHVYISGGAARSDFMIQALHRDLIVECKVWNPVSFLQMELSPEQSAEIEQVAPQLAVAIGAALAAL